MTQDFLKRWLDLLFWWVPGGSSRHSEGGERPAGARDPAGGATPPPAQASGRASAQKPAAAPEAPKPEPPKQEPAKPATAEDTDAPADDLTRIRGIGPAMAARLHEMGISTFDQLAGADSKALTQALRDKSVVISEKKVETWISDAAGLIQ